MSHEIEADYRVRYLFPPAVEDWIPADHPARFIREFVDSLDIGALGFRQRKSEEGRPNHGAKLLLKVWLYGYFVKFRSSRQLEWACRENLALIWLTGRHQPDHNTLWRFWRNNKTALRKLFSQAVEVALRAELVGMVLQAVDGTKIAAVASTATGWHRRRVERRLQHLEELLDAIESEVERAEKVERGEARMPEELKDRDKLREKIQEALQELNEREDDHLHPGEPEARMMKTEGKAKFAYNAQVVVDEQSGVIVAQEVVNEETDYGQLVPMLDQVEENLGQVAQETVADAGYHSAQALGEAQERGYSVLVNLSQEATAVKKRGEYHASRFEYDEGRDCCVCPRGEVLGFERKKWNRRKQYRVRVYRCQSFRECPVRWQCSRQKRGRTVEISPYHQAVVRQREKQKEDEKRSVLKRRAGIVEPSFAWIKQGMGFRRWTVRGLDGVQTQWALLCTVVNLRKLYALWKVEKLCFSP
ncbi:IS1182 family transposase [Acidobacteria bacterium AH-259-D05]|nr:IS1182 family transposase [Acidobacteria bacterium AH-259-D05]